GLAPCGLSGLMGVIKCLVFSLKSPIRQVNPLSIFENLREPFPLIRENDISTLIVFICVGIWIMFTRRQHI
ncbi:hypothetical protein, partial [Enterobacter chengduensis]|uniref:hypothetical protein n=1 Tax=Enterobacter chengduensis TaxID=2494701 RepID=UPI001A7ECE30